MIATRTILVGLTLCACQSKAPAEPIKASNVTTAVAVGAWGEPVDGLSTRLTVLNNYWTIGTPLRVKLELKNVTGAPTEYYEPSFELHDSFAITTANGTEAVFVEGPYQTTVTGETLAAGATVTLLEALDLANNYLLTEPGTLEIRNRASRPFRRPPGGAFPSSAAVAFEARPGITPSLHHIMQAIHNRLPESDDGYWQVWKNSHTLAAALTSSIICSYTPRGGPIGSSRRAQLQFSIDRLGEHFIKDMSQGDREISYLGTHSLGHAYVAVEPSILKVWPGIVDAVRDSIESTR